MFSSMSFRCVKNSTLGTVLVVVIFVILMLNNVVTLYWLRPCDITEEDKDFKYISGVYNVVIIMVL